MVELAIVIPLIALLLFGVLEASWAVSKQSEVRDAARQGARIAATTTTLDSPGVAGALCAQLDLPGAQVEVSGIGPNQFPGGLAFIEIDYPHTSLTGFLGSFTSITISERLEFRVEATEQAPWWSPGGGGAC